MPPEAPQIRKRKQRSPFYARVFKDGSRTAKPWCLDVHVRSEAGKRRTRTFYSLEREAKAAAEKAQRANINTGLASADISPALSTDALEAAHILKGRATLVEAVEYYVSHVFPPGGEMKLGEAVARYQKWQEDEGASKAYLVDLKWRLNRLVKKLPATIQLPEITWLMLDHYLSRLKLNPVGRQNEIRNIRPFFNWAIDLKLIASNPIPSRALATRKKDRTRTQVIHILSVEQAKLLLENAGPLLPHIVFGLFCGARPDETKALEWQDVNWTQKRVTINSRNSTTHDRRTVPIPENALLWLEPYRQAVGLVSPPGSYITRLRKAGEKANLLPWPKDCLRHSFASYWLAKHEDETQLKFLMGHHESSHMLRKHYLDRGVSSEQAEEYWKLSPDSKSAKISE